MKDQASTKVGNYLDKWGNSLRGKADVSVTQTHMNSLGQLELKGLGKMKEPETKQFHDYNDLLCVFDTN